MERGAELIGAIAERLLADADALTEELDATIFTASPELARDATIAAETRASNQANLMRWLTATARHPGEPIPPDVPPEALDVARTLVRRGIQVEALMHAYRAGQNLAWRRWMQVAAEVATDRAELVEVLELSSTLIFGHIDAVLGQVLEAVQREREELLGGALARRTETVRLILDGAPLDEDRASAQLGYELARRHTAAVLWVEPRAGRQGALERAATTLARAAGARRPLTLPAGTATLWAWLGTDGDPDGERLREAMEREAEPHVRAALGPTRPGITGFRRSHVSALAAQRLLAGTPSAERFATYHEVEVVALAAQDEERMTEFVASTLGPLAADDEASERLRDTLRVFLDEGGNAPRAGRRLHAHRNTVLHRVSRAEELLGHPVGERRLGLALALELAHRLGPRALA